MKSLLFLALLACAPLLFAEAPEISGGEVRETPPGMERTAAYMTLHNNGDRDCRLVAATSPVAGRLEVHGHRQKGGMMRMRPLEAIAVAAGAQVVLEPGGRHLMLLELTGPLAGDDKVEMELDFGECGTRKVTLPVTAY